MDEMQAGAPEPPQSPDPPDSPAPPDTRRGLLAWLGIVAGGGILGVLLGHAEAGVFFALAGVFALAQATDAAAAYAGYRAWVHAQLPRTAPGGAIFRVVVRAIVPVAGALFYAGFATYTRMAGADGPHRFAVIWCAVAAVVSLSLAFRPVADAATRLCFRTGPVGRTRRLTARIVVIALLMPVPVRIVMPDLMNALKDSGTPIADPGGLVAQLAGEIALALAGVGWLVRRNSAETRERLGLGALAPRSIGVIVLGVAGAIGLNTGMEWVQHHWFPVLWQQDSDMTRLIAAKLPLATSLLLGVSAGFGEEITVRGALQPRLGIVLSSILFASGHVQYTWFGMLTVGMLGALLGLIRARTNTTTAIVVHAIYDVFAAVTAGSP